MHQALQHCNLRRTCKEWSVYPKVQIYKEVTKTDPWELHQTNQCNTNNVLSSIIDNSNVKTGKKSEPVSKLDAQLLTMPPLEQKLRKVCGKKVATLLFRLLQLYKINCFPRLKRCNDATASLVYGPSCTTQKYFHSRFPVCWIPVIVPSI